MKRLAQPRNRARLPSPRARCPPMWRTREARRNRRPVTRDTDKRTEVRITLAPEAEVTKI